MHAHWKLPLSGVRPISLSHANFMSAVCANQSQCCIFPGETERRHASLPLHLHAACRRSSKRARNRSASELLRLLFASLGAAQVSITTATTCISVGSITCTHTHTRTVVHSRTQRGTLAHTQTETETGERREETVCSEPFGLGDKFHANACKYALIFFPHSPFTLQNEGN